MGISWHMVMVYGYIIWYNGYMIWYRQWFDLIENPWKSAHNTIVIKTICSPLMAGVSCIFFRVWIGVDPIIPNSILSSLPRGLQKIECLKPKNLQIVGLSGWMPVLESHPFRQTTHHFLHSLHCNEISENKIDTKIMFFFWLMANYYYVMSQNWNPSSSQVPRSDGAFE